MELHHRAPSLKRPIKIAVDPYQTHPERFVRKPPTPPPLPTTAWINKPEEDTPTQ